VRQIYRTVAQAWGPQHWWPAETPFEVIAGAILTQNTSWINVERALANLRNAGALSAEGIRNLALADLEKLVRPSGYFRQKAQRLKQFIGFLDAKYSGSIERMVAVPAEELRMQLLGLNGIGPETADSILLYAGLQPVFVVDAYTRRILERHQAVSPTAKYEEIRQLVESALSQERAFSTTKDSEDGQTLSRPPIHAPSAMSTVEKSELTRVYNEMHGLFVQLGKHYCHKQMPKCNSCPVGGTLSAAQRSRLLQASEKALPVTSMRSGRPSQGDKR
jgi:endonuclease III related protein